MLIAPATLCVIGGVAALVCGLCIFCKGKQRAGPTDLEYTVNAERYVEHALQAQAQVQHQQNLGSRLPATPTN